MDRRDAPHSLKHEVALLGEEEVVAPALQRECGSDSLAPEARRISEASRKGLLRCAVCGTTVRRMFGSRKRWHFAVLPGGRGCDHEGETVAHREAKLALFDSLSASLAPGWSVRLEQRLENGRRPDVLAIRGPDGPRVAFEVQYADLSEAAWRERHRDYQSIDVRDVWLLGRVRQGRRRDVLAGTLATEEGQRVVYVGRCWKAETKGGALPFEAEEAEKGAEELLFGDMIFFGEARLLRPGSRGPEVYGKWTPGGGSWLQWARRVAYDLEEIRLLEDGSLRTPADGAYEAAEEKYGGRRRTVLGVSRETERYVPAPDQPGPGALPKDEGKRGEGWMASSERSEALRKLGPALVALLEREGAGDRALCAEPGRWKTRFFLEHVEGRVGKPLDFHHAAWGVIRIYRRPGEIGPGWGALACFRDLLASEGFIRFEGDDKGMARYWRIARDSSPEHSGG